MPKTRPKPKTDPSPDPSLRFAPTAWAKLLFLRDRGPTEIGAFGVSAEDDLLLVEDVVAVGQEAGPASVLFDDEAVADFFERMVDAGLRPERFARIWAHTHPGGSPAPSSVDEETFARVFGGCDWAVMLVLADGGATYARLRFNVGPGGEAVLPVAVDFSHPFAGSDHEAWEAEYRSNVRRVSWGGAWSPGENAFPDDADFQAWGDPRLADLLDLDPEDREMVRRHLENAAGPDEIEEVLDAHYGAI